MAGLLLAAVPLLAAEALPGASEKLVGAPASRFALSPDEPLTPHDFSVAVAEYLVEDGDTLGAIALQHGRNVDTLRWANQLDDPDKLSIGQHLWLPPADGVLVRVGPNDTLGALLERFHGDLEAVTAYNHLRSGQLPPIGVWLMIPDGEGPPLVRPDPPPPASVPHPGPAPASSFVRPAVALEGAAAGRFPFGQCTWYVAQKRYVPWSGNAWQWYENARAFGYRVGGVPSAGAIQVTWESYVGHVAYVESVDGDGSWTVSEMNFRANGGGWGRVSWRRITPGKVPLIGFIY